MDTLTVLREQITRIEKNLQGAIDTLIINTIPEEHDSSLNLIYTKVDRAMEIVQDIRRSIEAGRQFVSTPSEM